MTRRLRACLRAVACCALIGLALCPAETPATRTPLSPREVIVVASLHAPDSVEIAREYVKARGIPEKQFLVTGMPQGESVSRRDYDQYIAGPIREFLVQEKLTHVRCIVLVYGVPLKVLEPKPLPDAERMERRLREERDAVVSEVIALTLEAHALAGNATTTAALPKFESADSARKQLNDLGRLMLAQLKQAHDKQADPKALEALVLKAFGADAAGAWQKLGAAPPPPPANLQERIAQLGAITSRDLTPGDLPRVIALLRELRGVFGVVNGIDALLIQAKPDWTWRASVDSELAALFWPAYPLARYQRNALNLHIAPSPGVPHTIMTCRLDGPDAATVRRMLKDSLATEALGLRGHAYIDARGFGRGNAYGNYDVALQGLARILDEGTTIPTTLENTQKLFTKDQCPDTALYSGWYSLSKYIPAFTFVPGAVGYHVASDEARTLKKTGAQNWVPNLLRDGMAATLGPVEEPYLTAFPLPTEFFTLLLTGRYTLAECYWKTVPHVSWMMTLVGDPLYTPFKANPALKAETIEQALRGETGARQEEEANGE